MSGIEDAEISTIYGGLDSAAFASGNAAGAHLLRTMAMQANRAIAKEEHWFSLLWPRKVTTISGVGDYRGFTGAAWPYWTRVHPPLPMPKRPGLTKASFRIAFFNISGTGCLELQIATTARPFRTDANSVYSPNVIAITDSGDDIDAEIDDVPVADGPLEMLDIRVRGCPGSIVEGDTGTYGSPSNGTINVLRERSVQDTSATWNGDHGDPTWATRPHLVQLEDVAGNVIAARRITGVDSSNLGVDWNILQFSPALSAADMSALRGGSYRILEEGAFELATISASLQARTD